MDVVTSKGPTSEAVRPRRAFPADLCSRSTTGLGASPAEHLRHCCRADLRRIGHHAKTLVRQVSVRAHSKLFDRRTAVGKLSGGNKHNSKHAASTKSEKTPGRSTVKSALRVTKKSGIWP